MQVLARQTKQKLCLDHLLLRQTTFSGLVRRLVRRLRSSTAALALALTLATMPLGSTLGGIRGATAGAEAASAAAAASVPPASRMVMVSTTAQGTGDIQAVGADSDVFPAHVTATALLRHDGAAAGEEAHEAADPVRAPRVARPTSSSGSSPGGLVFQQAPRMGSGRTPAMAMVSNTATPENPVQSAGLFVKNVAEMGKDAILELKEDVQGESDVARPLAPKPSPAASLCAAASGRGGTRRVAPHALRRAR